MTPFAHSSGVAFARRIAAQLRPAKPLAPSAWARENLIVPDGPRKLGKWDAELTPYICEPLDMTSVESPVNEIVVMKSLQTAFTTMLLAAIGHTIDCEPADMMVVQPTDGALTDFNSLKLQLCLDKTKPTAEKVLKQTSRGGAGSSTYEKKFARGNCTLALALASSTADLRSKSVKKVFADEIDEYAEDLEGQGSPFDMLEGRQESFLKAGDWKRVLISTPTVKGASHIERFFETSDKRRWHVRCSHCRSEFVFEFGPNFRFARTWPYPAEYVCPSCGSFISDAEHAEMVRRGRWIATAPGPGKIPGFHFDALSSPFVPWSKIAERATKAEGNPAKLKSFTNLTLGLPFEVRGDAPDHVRLLERREDGLLRGHVPPRGLLLVAAADVQMRGIWVEILAIAPDRQSWVVDAFYVDGSTEAPGAMSDAADTGNALSQLLHKTIGRDFPDAFGRMRRLDALAIDSGYRSHVVYATVRRNQRLHPMTGQDTIFAVDGRDGWGKPAIGTPSLVDIDLAGHRVKKGCKIWPIGTWPLKGAFYADLRKDGRKAGAEVDPPGYCHFATWLDEGYFRQITAEYLAEETYRGRAKKLWKKRGSERDNHFLDCRVYNLALAEYLGLSSITQAEWAALAHARGMPETATTDLFRSGAGATPAPPPPRAMEDDALDAELERLGDANAALWDQGRRR